MSTIAECDAVHRKAAEAAAVGTVSALAVAVALERKARRMDASGRRATPDPDALGRYVEAYEAAGGSGKLRADVNAEDDRYFTYYERAKGKKMRDMSGDATLDMDLKKTKARIAARPTPVARHAQHHHRVEGAGLFLLGAGGLFGLGWLLNRKAGKR